MKKPIRRPALLVLLVRSLRQADELRIGALNIEWPGVPNNRSGIAHGVAQDSAGFAEYIKRAMWAH